jgi:hypothetical protein
LKHDRSITVVDFGRTYFAMARMEAAITSRLFALEMAEIVPLE